MNTKQTNRKLTSRLPVALLMISAAAMALPTGGAHTGQSCLNVAPATLEGECYSTAPSSCDPDFDGEHTQVFSSGGHAGVFMPHSGCSVTYTLDAPLGRPTAATFKFSGSLETFSAKINIVSDGVLTASCTVTAGGEVWTTGGSCSGEIIPGQITVSYTITQGPGYGNLWLDSIGLSLL